MSGTTTTTAAKGAVSQVTFQNAGAALLAGGVTTFGQTFERGEVSSGSGVVASVGGTAAAVQMDVKTRWEDGSVKMAVLSVERPTLAAGQSLDVTLAAASAPSASALDLGASLAGQSFAVKLDFASGASVTVDALAALRTALGAGTASFWQQGPLASQARVEVEVANTSMRLVFDVTAFKGGGMAVDVQFANDRAMEAIGGRLSYTATVTMNGSQVARETVEQLQYQSWHAEFTSGPNGGQGLGSPTAGWLNIKHDVAELGRLGVVADYDLSLKIDQSKLQGYASYVAAPDFGDPLSPNGVAKYMPGVGGRQDIGFTTEPNTAWLISGDARAAAYAMGQAEAAGAVPWRYWDGANDTWLNAGDYPKLWIDPRDGIGQVGNPNSTGPTQFMEWGGHDAWTPETAHQPDLSFVPYTLTGERWMLDNLLAQGAWNTVANWPGGERPNELTGEADLVVKNVQVRAAAWSLRQIENAAWAAPEGSAERTYFSGVAEANWKWMVAQLPAWTEMQGNSHGWIPNYWWQGGTAPWQQDFFASTAILAASRGNGDALTVLNWMKNFLIGRFEQSADVFNIRDGIAITLVTATKDPATGWATEIHKGWAAIGQAMVSTGASNFDGWERSQGYYGQLALASLAGIWQLTGDARAKAAYEKLLAMNPPFTTPADLAASPTFAIAIGEPGTRPDPGPVTLPPPDTGSETPQPPTTTQPPPASPPPPVTPQPEPPASGTGTGGTVAGTAGNDVRVLTTAAQDLRVDLGAGADKLTLFSRAANQVTVSNVETVIGGDSADVVTLGAPVGSGVIDLGGGADKLILAATGVNRLTVSGVETLIGGAGEDIITLGRAVNGAVVDLGGSKDRLTLASDGANRLTVSNVATILGGTAADDVILGTAMTGGLVDLGGGADRLTLSSAGANRLTVQGVETVTGGAAADVVVLGAALSGGSINLGGGADKLVLSSLGNNSVTVGGTETICGGSLSDDVILGTAMDGGRVDLGAGADRLVLSSAGPNRVTVADTEVVIGGAMADDVTIAEPSGPMRIDLGGGVDRLALQTGVGNTATISGVEALTGGGANDDITLDAPVTGMTVDLRGGTDRLVLSSAGANTLTVTGVEKLLGGAAADSVTLGAAAVGITVDLGGGADRLVLSSAGANTLTVTGVEKIFGGAAADSVTLGAAAVGITVDLGGGADRLALSSAGFNWVTAANVEVVTGGAMSDVIQLSTAVGALLAGGNGNDALVGNAGADTLIGGRGTDQLRGGDGADRFMFGDGAERPAFGASATATGGPGFDGRDRILDFTPGTDLIDLSNLDANTGVLGNQAFGFGGESRAVLANSVTWFSTSTGTTVQVDQTGDAVADLIIDLTGRLTLKAADFVL